MRFQNTQKKWKCNELRQMNEKAVEINLKIWRTKMKKKMVFEWKCLKISKKESGRINHLTNQPKEQEDKTHSTYFCQRSKVVDCQNNKFASSSECVCVFIRLINFETYIWTTRLRVDWSSRVLVVLATQQSHLKFCVECLTHLNIWAYCILVERRCRSKWVQEIKINIMRA